MSLEALRFGLSDPLQANTAAKPYDAFALFVDSDVLQSDTSTDALKKATIIQTLNEYQRLVKYYHDNGALTTFYLGDAREPTTMAALQALGYGPSDLNGWSIMWIRAGGRLEDARINFSGGIDAAGIDNMLRTNSNHDPAIDMILPFSSINGNDVPVQAQASQQIVASEMAPPSTPAPTFFSTPTVVTAEMGSSSSSSATTSGGFSMPVAVIREVKIPWFVICLVAYAAWRLLTAPSRNRL